MPLLVLACGATTQLSDVVVRNQFYGLGDQVSRHNVEEVRGVGCVSCVSYVLGGVFLIHASGRISFTRSALFGQRTLNNVACPPPFGLRCAVENLQ